MLLFLVPFMRQVIDLTYSKMIYVFKQKHGSSLVIALSSENQSLNNVAIVTALVFVITRIIMKQMEGRIHLSFSAPLKLLKAVSCAVVLDGLS